MDIVKLIQNRNRTYVENSNKIIDQFEGFLDQVFNGVSESSQANQFMVIWASIDFHITSSDLISVFGTTHYKVGSTVSLPSGDVVYIDEDNQHNFRGPVLKMVIPTNLLVENDVEGSILFVKEYLDILHRIDPEIVESALGDPEFRKTYFTAFGRNPDNEVDGNNPPKPVEMPMKIINQTQQKQNEFDLSKLDLDATQLSSMRILDEEGKA